MVLGLGRCIIGGHNDLADKGVREEVASKNHGICIRKTNIQTFLQVQHRGRVPVGS